MEHTIDAIRAEDSELFVEIVGVTSKLNARGQSV